MKLANTMNNNSIYVHGYDKSGRPIIWLRTARKPWFLADVDAEVNLHIIMTDFAIGEETSPPPFLTPTTQTSVQLNLP